MFQVGELAVIEEYKEHLSYLLTNLWPLLAEWREYVDSQMRMDICTAYQVPVIRSGRRGRPKYLITNEQLDYLLSLEFTGSDISALLGVSRMTLYRRRRELGLLTSHQQGITDGLLYGQLTSSH